jgi:hypothetical protein
MLALVVWRANLDTAAVRECHVRGQHGNFLDPADV